MKVFGVTEFAIRFPSVIMCSLWSRLLTGPVKLLAGESTGYFAALFSGTSYYLLTLVSGKQPVDHNDVSFLFFVSASLWSWVEYSVLAKWRWILWTGLFAGHGGPV